MGFAPAISPTSLPKARLTSVGPKSSAQIPVKKEENIYKFSPQLERKNKSGTRLQKYLAENDGLGW